MIGYAIDGPLAAAFGPAAVFGVGAVYGLLSSAVVLTLRSVRGVTWAGEGRVNLLPPSGSRTSGRVGLTGGGVDAEAEGFAQFVAARERALQRTAWLLTGDWAWPRIWSQTGAGAVVAALGADQALRRPGNLRAPGPGEHLGELEPPPVARGTGREALLDRRAPGDMAAEVAVRSPCAVRWGR